MSIPKTIRQTIPGTRRVLLFVFVAAIHAFAAAEPGAKGHHIHLAASDTKAAADWYAKHMEGTYERVIDKYDGARFESMLILFKQGEPGFQGSEGSTVDHIGWSFKDLDAKMKEFEAAGIKILQPARPLGKIKFGFIVDPWGTKIEVMQDPALYGFHHIHLHVVDPDATVKFYSEAFGGEPGKYAGVLPGVNYGGFWLLAQKFPKEKAGTAGRSVDHLGWSFPDVDAAAASMKARGVKIVEEPHAFGSGKKAVIEGPGGVAIELVEKRD